MRDGAVGVEVVSSITRVSDDGVSVRQTQAQQEEDRSPSRYGLREAHGEI